MVYIILSFLLILKNTEYEQKIYFLKYISI